MTLPEYNELGYLPGGVHESAWEEVVSRFGGGPRRKALLRNLETVVAALRAHGVRRIWLDGSFVTDKRRPGDVDVVYRIEPGADRADWPDVGPSRRLYVKNTFLIDLWRWPSPQPRKNVIGSAAGQLQQPIDQWFGTDRDGNPKGLVLLVETEATDDQE